MSILEKASRFVAIAVALLFIGVSLFCILGAWFANRWATDVALKGFGRIEVAVEVVDAGVARVEDLIITSRTEVRQTSETIIAVGARAAANNPVLSALNERVETRLLPRVAQMQQALAPVRDAVATIGAAVSLVSSIPMIAEMAPRLASLDETFNRLGELSADTMQLRSTLRALVAETSSEITDETVATLRKLTQRIDTRLGEVQANLQGVRGEVAAFHDRLDTRKSRLLCTFNLLALLVTLMLTWILYTQIVVILHHWARIKWPAAKP